MPPRHVPSASDHSSGRMGRLSFGFSPSWMTIGRIACTYGMLSMAAETKAEIHTRSVIANARRERSGTASIHPPRRSPIAFTTPSSESPSIIMKSDAKNRSVPHSTCSRTSSMLCTPVTMSMARAPRIAIQARLRWIANTD
eukprot:Amastigsp_a678637_19.p4 type:complete len:141 gc:universal Amastigsp_a678637_19:2100-1678(-)